MYLGAVRTRARKARKGMAGLFPSGTIVLPSNRRVTTLSAYDRRARTLHGLLGDDGSDDPSIGTFTAQTEDYNPLPLSVTNPSVAQGIEYGLQDQAIAQSSAQYAQTGLQPNAQPGNVPYGSNLALPTGTATAPTTTVLPSGQVVSSAGVASGASLGTWFSESTIVSGMTNGGVLALGGIAAVALSMLSGKKRRR
jgi:hypothetical protein